MAIKKFRMMGLAALLALMALPLGQSIASGSPTRAGAHRALQASTDQYHLSSSLVPGIGAQVMHIDGILTLMKGSGGALTGSTLRLSTGPTVQVTGTYTDTLAFAMDVNGVHAIGVSTAISLNRISGLYLKGTGGSTVGFWVATLIAPARAGVKYTFSATVASGPDKGTSFKGSLELFGDRFGGLLGYLTLTDGTVLRVDGQDVNGNVNMSVIVREGTPMFVSGTTVLGGDLRGTVAGPLAGDEGTWTATK
jgi:hypothetical protein